MKTIIVVAALWFIAIVVTFILTRATNLFTYLGPVQFICMLGSIVTIRSSMKSRKS